MYDIKENQSSTNYLNTLRVLAILSVIIAHSNAPICTYYSKFLSKIETYICILLVGQASFAVITFVMITGVLFLNPSKELTYDKILKKNFLRIILAIVFFGIPYSFMEVLFNSNLSFNVDQIGTAILNTIQGKSWAHIWYLYMIAGLYLCIPIIKSFVNNSSKSTIKYILIILFIFTSILPNLYIIIPYRLGIYILIDSVYFFYLILGYYIHYYKININNKILWLMITAYIIFLILMPLNSNFVDLSFGGNILLNGPTSPIVVMATFAIFSLALKINKSKPIIDIISQIVFGMYLIHPLFINLIYKFLKFTPEKYPFIFVERFILTFTAGDGLYANNNIFLLGITFPFSSTNQPDISPVVLTVIFLKKVANFLISIGIFTVAGLYVSLSPAKDIRAL